MKLSEWAEHCQNALSAAGFHGLKPHRFGRIRLGVLQIIDFQGRKSDIYIWRNALPLCLPEMQLGMGCPPASGRIPKTVGKISTDSTEGVSIAKIALKEYLIDSVIPALDKVSDLNSLESILADSEMPHFAFYHRAFALFQIGEVKRGKAALGQIFPKPYPLNWRKHVEKLASVSETEVPTLIQSLSDKNVKKLRLGKLVRDDS